MQIVFYFKIRNYEMSITSACRLQKSGDKRKHFKNRLAEKIVATSSNIYSFLKGRL